MAEATPYGGSAYTVAEGASQTLIVPIALHNAYGGFTTQLNVFNPGSAASNIQATFYTNDGALAATQTFSLNSHNSQTLDQATMVDGFIGWAVLVGTGPIVAQVLEQNPNSHFVAIMNAQANAKTKLYGPAIFNNAFGGFYTGANRINPNSIAANVTLTYHDHTGSSLSGGTFSLAAHGAIGVFQAARSGVGLPTGGVPDGFYGALEVTSDSGGLVLVVNEAGGLTSTGNARSGTYAAAGGGEASMVMPVMANGAYGGYVTGATILNSSAGTIGGTIQYYDLNGAVVGNARPFTIAPYASLPVYQGSDGLPDAYYGSALVVQTSGIANSLISTANAQSTSFFYTYTEPTN